MFQGMLQEQLVSVHKLHSHSLVSPSLLTEGICRQYNLDILLLVRICMLIRIVFSGVWWDACFARQAFATSPLGVSY